MRILGVALICLPLASAGCGQVSATGPGLDEEVVENGVQASRVTGGVQVTNRTGRPMAYAVWNRGWLAMFAPCADPGPGCVRLVPGATVVVPLEEIDGYVTGAPEALVRWWHVVPDGAGGYRAREVHEIIVPL
ncbi:MAG TPA: hypothetical protein VHG28_16955 [Longimicrobiaceae bacterium]|nr:hypothetical protein [Longimicrobiaceae bacterium]